MHVLNTLSSILVFLKKIIERVAWYITGLLNQPLNINIWLVNWSLQYVCPLIRVIAKSKTTKIDTACYCIVMHDTSLWEVGPNNDISETSDNEDSHSISWTFWSSLLRNNVEMPTIFQDDQCDSTSLYGMKCMLLKRMCFDSLARSAAKFSMKIKQAYEC